MVYVEPKEPVIKLPQRAPQRKYIKSYFDEFDRVLHGPNWKDPATELPFSSTLSVTVAPTSSWCFSYA